MDSWRQSIGTEGCSSSESGWTMYIESPMEEDDCSNIENEANEDGFYGDNNNNRRRRLLNKKDEGDSDDSMASDASSGPTHNHANNNVSATSNKKDKKDHSFAGKFCSSSGKISNKNEKKRLDSRNK